MVIISVTEGDDKPLKYPHMFATADLVVINKTDLLPYVDFDLDAFDRYARSLNPERRDPDAVGEDRASTWTTGTTGSRLRQPSTSLGKPHKA